jgi:hypothetical protein
MSVHLRHYGTRGVLLVLVAGCYLFARPSTAGDDERMALAGALRFDVSPLEPAGPPATRTIRRVHPELTRIDAWISSVGAAVALGDVDDDGLPNDVCLVDPRNDSVTIRGVPGAEGRYEPFTLQPMTDGYDPATIAPMGCLLGDVNEDGLTDAVIYYWGRTPLAFIRRPGLSAAAFTPVEIAASRERWFTNAALFSDVDGDGHADLVFGNYFRDGDRILDPSATEPAEMQHSMSRAYNSGTKRLLRWRSASAGSVTYEDASAALPLDARHGWTLALGARDLDGDLLPELYVANDFGPDRLLHNRSTPGHPSFAIVEGRRGWFTPRSKVLGQDSFKGMGVDFGDVNGDGRADIAVSNIARRFALVESHFLFVHTGEAGAFARGVAPYADESSRRGTSTGGWGWDLRIVDLDNDGTPEIVQANGFVHGRVNRWPELQEVATGNDELLAHPSAWPRFTEGDDLSGQDADSVFVADARGRYRNVADLVGVRGPTVSRGIAVGDVDGDGRLDVAIARQWMPSVLLHNRSPARHAALTLDLRLPAGAGSRPAIGARADVTLPDGRHLVDDVDGGSGHSGKRAPLVHFGLGDLPADAALKVRISWRAAGTVQTLDTVVAPGRHVIVLPGS